MKKKYLQKTYTRIGAAALAVLLALPGTGASSVVSAADQTQMVSAPEMVYANVYDDSTVRTQDFDENWKFYLGDVQGAETANYDDSAWKQVTLPHDYSIEQEYNRNLDGESGYLPGGTGWYRKHFTVGDKLEGKRFRVDFGGVYMDCTVWVNGEKLGGHPYGYTPFSFDITEQVKFGQENVITVKVNHETPSSRFYSGSGIYRNVNLVITDPVHVDLYGTKVTTPNLENEKNGTVKMAVETTIANDGTQTQSVALTYTVFPKGGDPAQKIGEASVTAQSVAADSTQEISSEVSVKNPKLWSVDEPNLYTVRTEVKVGNKVVDTYDTDYGFRYFKFDANEGFSLNGVRMKLKGVCMHHDQGSLGSEAYYRSTERQVELLKQMGCNAIRVTHNPASNELIEACNKHGILLVEEAFDGWIHYKNGNTKDYARFFNVKIEDDNQIIGKEADMTWAHFDLASMINRGYNAPSIIMWSLGNEVWQDIREGSQNEYPAVAEQLAQWTRELDKTRPATIGDNNIRYNNTNSLQFSNSLRKVDGVIGANYPDGGSYDSLHSAHPDWPLYGSETASAVNSRGIYDRKTSNGDGGKGDMLLTSYDKSAVSWGTVASSSWYDVIKRDYAAGEFVWTGFDYIGEPTPWNGIDGMAAGASWPAPKNSYFGIIDTAGFPKDTYYFYQSQWNDKVHTLHILPVWNEDLIMTQGNDKQVEVVVYTDAAAVELRLTTKDGQTKVVGQKKTFEKKKSLGGGYYEYQVCGGDSHQNMYLTWNIPFEEGTLTAVAFDESGQEIKDTEGRSYVTTTGAAEKLAASVDRDKISADGKDLAYITVDVTDANGNIVPDADNKVTFDVQGDGVLIGVDNGKQPDHQSYQDNNRQAFSGKVLAIVQSTKQAGSFTVTASAEGLTSSKVTVTTEATGTTTTQKQLLGFYMSKNYYVKRGSVPTFPEKVEARYTDDSTEEMTVTWDKVTSEQTAEKGSFAVNGTVASGYTVSVIVNVIDEIGALLNYSTTVSVGVVPQLPDSRPAIMPDGKDAGVSLPVTWKKPAASAYAEPGTVIVKGTANVFGKIEEVTASIRVQQGDVKLNNSMSNQAQLEENIGGAASSNNLDALKDGVTDKTGNNDIWSNKNAAAVGIHQTEVQYRFVAQQSLGEVVIYYVQNEDGATAPVKGATKFYFSESGEDGTWTRVRPKETIGTPKNGVIPYTYSFSSDQGTLMRFAFTDNTSSKSTTAEKNKVYTAITEIEVKTATVDLTTNSSAALSEVVVNGMDLTAEEIARGEFSVTESEAVVTAVGEGNAAATVLPAYNDEIKILVQAEDHVAESEFVVHLNTTGTSQPDEPEDDSRDYPWESTTAVKAGSEYTANNSTTDGPKEWAVDGNTGTWWHTDYANNHTSTDVGERYIVIKTAEKVKLDALRYLPRTGAANGRVTTYKIEYSDTGEDNSWTEAATGDWENSEGWKLAEFKQPVETQYVKLTGVNTVGASNQNNMFMTAAEIRLRKYQEEIPGAESISVKTNPTKTSYVEGEVFEPAGLELTVVTGGKSATVAYSEQTKDNFRFTPLLGKALKGGIEKVNVFYAGVSTEIPVTVTGKGNKQELRERYDVLDRIFANVGEAGFDQKEYDKYKNHYTEGSFAAYQVALGSAKDVLADENATSSQVEKALSDLESSYEALAPNKSIEEYNDMKDTNQWYVTNADIKGAYKKGLMLGKNETTFAPTAQINRAEVAIVLYRMGGLELAAGKGEGFSDTQIEWMKNAIVWANHEDIVTGYTDTNTFRPANAISRQELALMLYRYASYQGYDLSTTEDPDAEVHWDDLGAYDGWPSAETAMRWCVAKGIIKGNNGKIDAQGTAVRAQAAIMFNRLVERFG